MKKTISAIFTALILITSTASVFAIFNNFTVVDKAGYLTENQLAELSKQLDDVRQKYNFDVAVYIEEVMSGADAESTADDLYDYTVYGYGENSDGIMLYIAADEREYHFTVHGSGETIFNDNGLAYLESKTVPSLQEDDYYTATKLYGEYCEELLEMAAQGEPYNEKNLSIGYVCTVVGCALILPLLLAHLMTKKKLKQMKTAVENNYAANYMKPGSMNLSMSRDIFLYSTVTKTEKAKSNSGGHTSSSGEHHGGKGGSF